ncbi:signal peptidase I [Alkalicaulis satelles]|uniref:Signal peptidase I n=2 Tax=Alkalicaulis satelles TaxID=2609175 RepID=A0A5M6ZL03_9PROT|nr:signal peptidase I [Alkalicaulis satelles]
MRANSSLLWTLVLAGVIALTVRTLVFQPFTIPSDSMRPALEPGDYVAVAKWPYGWSRLSLPLAPPLPRGRVFERLPERGDIVVFTPPHAPRTAYIKRVIGLPGDMVTVSGAVVHINGAPVPRGLVGEETRLSSDGEMTRYQVWQEILEGGRGYLVHDAGPGPLTEFGPVLVPDGHVFVLGDNRSESRDSRAAAPEGPGMAPVDHIIGRADRVLLSVRPDFSLWKPWTWTRIRTGRTFLSLDPEPR